MKLGGTFKITSDLDYADEICLLAHKHSDIQNKLDKLAETTRLVGLKINIGQTKTIRIGMENIHKIKVSDSELEYVNDFCY